MEPLQSFRHDASSYERPTQRWVCGHAAEGHACHAGPDQRGRCGATFECRPAKSGNRFVCKRAADSGGECQRGPLPDGTCGMPVPPCVPVRSLRARRGRTAWMLFALVLGIAAVGFGTAGARWLISPGPLAVSHAAIGDCDQCHGKIGIGPIAWLHAALAPVDKHQAAGQCLSCHSLGSEGQEMEVHGRSSDDLGKRTQDIHEHLEDQARAAIARAERASPADAGAVSAAKANLVTVTNLARPIPDLDCTACHQEHRGAHADLRKISDAVCQTCHLEQFASLTDGHPEFGSWPYTRRTRIIYDHATHQNQYAAKSPMGAMLKDCNSCHVVGPLGRVMTISGFDKNCAACHANEIRDKAVDKARGIPVLSLVRIDTDELQKRGVGIGEWPDHCYADLSPMMRLLLSADPAVKADLAALAKVDFSDLGKATDEQVAAVGRVAWAIKAIFNDLAAKGPAGLQKRFKDAFGPDLADAAVVDLMSGLPRDLSQNVEHDWFPDLAKDMAAHDKGEAVPTSLVPAPGEAPKVEKTAAASPQPTPPPAASADSHADILGGGDNILGSAPAAAPAAPAGGESHADILGGGDNILGGATAAAPAAPAGGDSHADILGGGDNILGGATAAAPAAPTGSESHADILGGGDNILGAAPTPTVAAEKEAPSAAPAAAEAAPAQLPAEQWASLGGWYPQEFALYYRPLEHADRFMRAWLEASARMALDTSRAEAGKVFDTLSAEDTAGNCLTCHSVDQAGDRLVVNWKSRQPDPEARHATSFLHKAHFSLFANNGCETCHTPASGADYRSTYRGHDPLDHFSAFMPIPRATCAKCHTADVASESCTTCHNYHVGQIPLAKGVTTMQLQVQ